MAQQIDRYCECCWLNVNKQTKLAGRKSLGQIPSETMMQMHQLWATKIVSEGTTNGEWSWSGTGSWVLELGDGYRNRNRGLSMAEIGNFTLDDGPQIGQQPSHKRKQRTTGCPQILALVFCHFPFGSTKRK